MLNSLDNIKTRLRYWSSKQTFYHVVFWLFLFLVMFITNVSSMGFFKAFFIDAIYVSFFAIISYVNIFVFFPKYMKDKNLLYHIAAIFSTSLLLTPIKTILLFFFSHGNIELQALYIDNQLFIFLSTFFVGLSTSIYQILNDWFVQQKIKSELVSQNLQSELKFLKSQINPHFLFNTLNSLYALTLKKSDLAPEIVLKLSEMMRYMLYECNEKEVPLSKEINYMKNYLELEKLRQGTKMLVNLKINGESGDLKLAPLILIPFIENSFKHGINNQISQGFVDLELNIEGYDIQMILENSKSPSLPKIGEKRSGGIGLVNVKRRMEILYPENHKLDIIESPSTYKIELNLHLSNN